MEFGVDFSLAKLAQYDKILVILSLWRSIHKFKVRIAPLKSLDFFVVATPCNSSSTLNAQHSNAQHETKKALP